MALQMYLYPHSSCIYSVRIVFSLHSIVFDFYGTQIHKHTRTHTDNTDFSFSLRFDLVFSLILRNYIVIVVCCQRSG